MAMDKKVKATPVSKTSSPTNKKPTEKAPAKGASAGLKGKHVLLAAVLLVLVIVVLVLYVFNGSGSEESRPAAQMRPRPEMPAEAEGRPGPEGGFAARPDTAAPTPAPAAPTVVNTPKISKIARRLLANEEEYLRQYDVLAQAGKWSELAAWAFGHDLYVEAFHCATVEGKNPAIPPRFHDTPILVNTPEAGYRLITQREFEARAIPSSVKDYSYEQLLAELDQMQPGGGMSNLSHLASLLVRVDCAKGRELYRQSIKDKEFYSLLIREMKLAYFPDQNLKPEDAARGSWLSTPPMNLWLIRQMIAFDPTGVSGGTSAAPTRGPSPQAGPNGPGPMGPGGPPMGPGMPGPGVAAALTGEQAVLLQHRLLLLQILARRGGEVSSYLIGKLLEADSSGVLMAGVLSGLVKADYFSRFTGVYAEPLIEPFARGLEQHRNVVQEWTSLARLLAGMFNDRASQLVFEGVQNSMPLSGDLTFLLAAGGTRYSLTSLNELIKASKVQDVDVTRIFAFWTSLSEGSRRNFWAVIGDLLPSGKPSSEPGSGPPRGPFPTFPPPGMPSGMPPGMAGGPSMPPMPMPMPGSSLPAGANKPRGWPQHREFNATVDAEAAESFLKLLAQSASPTDKAPSPQVPPGPGMPPGMPPGMGPGMGPGMMPGPGMGSTGPAKLKTDALKCLISLYDPRLAGLFRSLIDDPQSGSLARLGLCALDDRGSCPALLKHFWKSPFELSKSETGGQETTAVAGTVSAPLDPLGLPACGISARDALVYFDYREAGKAFLSNLGEFIARKDPFEEPERIAGVASVMIEALGRWSVSGSAPVLADLIESTGDFGLRGSVRSNVPEQNPLAIKVRMTALQVLGKIGDPHSLEVILRKATYSQEDEVLGIAAKIALARRGASEAADLFLNMLDPAKKPAAATGAPQTAIASIDPALKDRADIALLGLSRTALTDMQASRAVDLVRRLSEPQAGNGQGRPYDLQERLVLSLLTRGQGKVLQGLAELVAESPTPGDGGASNGQAYYWNRTQGSEAASDFLKMINTLNQNDRFDDEDAVSRFVAAILRRQEAVLVPKEWDPETWNPKEALVRFGDSYSRPSPGMPMPGIGPMPMPMPMPAPPGAGAPTGNFSLRSRVKSLAAAGTQPPEFMEEASRPMILPPSMIPALPNPVEKLAARTLDLPFAAVFPNQGRAAREVGLTGITLVARLKEPGRHLKGLAELPFFRYLAAYMLWQTGDDAGRDELIRLLAAPSETNQDKVIKFLAVEQLEQFEDFGLVGALAEAARRTSPPITRARLADGAMHVAARAWENQMAGKARFLSDPARVQATAAIWKPIMDSRGYDRLLANPLVITLAALQSDEQVPKWLSDAIRLQCTRNVPVAEQAVGTAVEMIHGLNPRGNDALLDLYTGILLLTADPARVQAAAGQAAEAEKKESSGMKSTATTPPGTGERRSPREAPVSRRSPGRRFGESGAGPRPRAANYAYSSIGPIVVSAISDMQIPEVLPALVQLARARTDLAGLASIEVLKRDPKQGKVLIKQLMGETARNPEACAQAVQVLEFLAARPDAFTFEILARTGRSDPAVAEAAMTLIAKMNKDGQVPPDVNLAQVLKTILMSLATEMRPDNNLDAVVTKALDLTKDLNDPELNRIRDRILLIQENFKKQKAPRARRTFGQR